MVRKKVHVRVHGGQQWIVRQRLFDQNVENQIFINVNILLCSILPSFLYF